MRNVYDSLKWKSWIGALCLGVSMASLRAQAQNQQVPAAAVAPSPAAMERTPAQDSSAGKGEKKKTLSFEDELVEGATQKPELFYLFQKKNFNYKRLIKLRENFLPEMRKTSEDLQRVRSSN